MIAANLPTLTIAIAAIRLSPIKVLSFLDFIATTLIKLLFTIELLYQLGFPLYID